MNETDGKGTISKVGYLFDNPASFRKLEIEPNAFLNSHGQAAVRVIVYVHDTEVKQSSFLKEKTKSYSINDMGCNFPEKRTVWGAPWCEGVQGQGIGERLEFSLKKNNSYAEVFGKQKIFISIGYVDYSRPDLYNANSRPKILSVYINNTFYKDVRLEDTSEYQDLLKDRTLAASDTIKLVIKDVYPGEKYQDTCINDIFILPLRQEKQTEIQ